MAFDVGRASADALRRRVVVLGMLLESVPVLRLSPDGKAREREYLLAELDAVKRRLAEIDSDSH